MSKEARVTIILHRMTEDQKDELILHYDARVRAMADVINAFVNNLGPVPTDIAQKFSDLVREMNVIDAAASKQVRHICGDAAEEVAPQ